MSWRLRRHLLTIGHGHEKDARTTSVAVPPKEQRSDEYFVDAINRGDSSVFAVLYGRYRDWVVNLAYCFAGNRVDSLDVLQETFLYFLKKFPGFRLESKLTTFLYPVVQNLAVATAKKSRRHTSGGGGLEKLPIGETKDEGENCEELASVLATLFEGHREVFLMCFVDSMTLEEIASGLGILVGTVKSRLHNALSSLGEDPRTRRYFRES